LTTPPPPAAVGDGHDQHGEGRCFPTAPPGGDEEARPVRQWRAPISVNAAVMIVHLPVWSVAT
jgi:hypothetical protein